MVPISSPPLCPHSRQLMTDWPKLVSRFGFQLLENVNREPMSRNFSWLLPSTIHSLLMVPDYQGLNICTFGNLFRLKLLCNLVKCKICGTFCFAVLGRDWNPTEECIMRVYDQFAAFSRNSTIASTWWIMMVTFQMYIWAQTNVPCFITV